MCVNVYICVGGYDILSVVCSALAFGSDPDLLIPGSVKGRSRKDEVKQPCACGD